MLIKKKNYTIKVKTTRGISTISVSSKSKVVKKKHKELIDFFKSFKKH